MPFFFGRRRPLNIDPNLVEFVQISFNFAVAGWYALILWQTFRTIDRGPVLDRRDPDPAEEPENDLSID